MSVFSTKKRLLSMNGWEPHLTQTGAQKRPTRSSCVCRKRKNNWKNAKAKNNEPIKNSCWHAWLKKRIQYYKTFYKSLKGGNSTFSVTSQEFQIGVSLSPKLVLDQVKVWLNCMNIPVKDVIFILRIDGRPAIGSSFEIFVAIGSITTRNWSFQETWKSFLS